MKVGFLFFVIFLLFHLCLSQTSGDAFIVSVLEYKKPKLEEASLRCYGTIITPSHVLTAASCVVVPSTSIIAIETSLDTGAPDGRPSTVCKPLS